MGRLRSMSIQAEEVLAAQREEIKASVAEAVVGVGLEGAFKSILLSLYCVELVDTFFEREVVFLLVHALGTCLELSCC